MAVFTISFTELCKNQHFLHIIRKNPLPVLQAGENLDANRRTLVLFFWQKTTAAQGECGGRHKNAVHASIIYSQDSFCKEVNVMNDMIPHAFHYRKKSTGWQVILSYKADGKWKQKSKQGFSQKSLAKAAGEKLLKEIAENYVPTPADPLMQNITLKQFWAIYQIDKKKQLSDGSIDVYENAIAAFSDLCNIPLPDLTRAYIQNCVNESKLSASTVELYMSKFKVMIRHAITFYELLRKSPMDGIIYPEINEEEIQTISTKEFNCLYAYLHENQYMLSVMAAVGYYAGLRYGEIAGLTWASIDLDKKELKVIRQFKRFRTAEKTYEYKLGKLKTSNSKRTIPMPITLQRILTEYKEAKFPVAPDGRIFYLKNSETNIINHHIKKVLPDTSIHVLRHTYATTLLARGVDIKSVAALLGDTVETVIKKYVHYSEEMRRNAAQNIQNIFDLE